MKGPFMIAMRSTHRFLSAAALAAILVCWAPPQALAQRRDAAAPWVGMPPVTETTEAIMARNKTLKPSTKLLNKFERDNEERENAKLNPLSPLTSQWPLPKNGQAQGGLVPSGARKVESLRFDGDGAHFLGGTLSDTASFPPDTMGAAGPTQFLVGINGRIRVFSKAGVKGALDTTMDNFFASVMTPPINQNFTSDPRVRYDRLSQRWFVIIIDVPYPYGQFENRVLIAMSDGPTITAGTVWSFFQFRHDQVAPAGDTNRFADYPTLGIDAKALYIGVNLFSTVNGSFQNTTGFVVRKSSLTSGGPIVATAFRGLISVATGAGLYTPQGVDNDDPAANEGYFIAVDNATWGTLMMRRITDPGGTPSISGNFSITVPATYFPVKVPHLGNTGGFNGYLDALDDRLFAAQIHRNRLTGVSSLTTAHNVRVHTLGQSNANGTRNAVRWYEIGSLSGTPTLMQGGTIYDGASTNPNSVFIPSIAMSGQGRMIIGCSFSGATMYASALIAERFASTAAGTFASAFTAKSGSAAYNPPSDPGGSYGRRWGDYSFTCVDPADDMTIWSIQEYTDSTNSYGVEVLKLMAPPPAAIASLSPASANPGDTLNIVVNGTSSAESGFYEPAALWQYVNHIQASFSGSGVTVNSVTFTDPTHVTINVTVAANAAAGTRNLTITNPDGQASTANAVFTVNSSVVTPTLDVPDVAGAVGETVTLKATLTYNGSGVAGKSVTIKLDGAEVPGSPVNTDSNGLASLPYTIAEGSVGSHPISGAFAGDGSYSAASDSGTLTVSPSGTAITVPNLSGYPGQSVTIKALLARTSDASALVGKSLSFKVGATVIGSSTTDAVGMATRTYTIPSTTTVGTILPITATYAGDANYNSSTGTGDLAVKTKATLTTSSASGTYGTTINLKGTLKVGTTLIQGAEIRFLVDGVEVGEATTDSTGVALLPHQLTEYIGAHSLKTEFDGNATLAPAIGSSTTLTVKAITTSLTVPAVTAIPGANATFKATLKSGTTLLSGRTVDFLIDGGAIGSAVTDSNGLAQVSHTISEAFGTHTITAKFAGEGNYGACTGSGTLTVKLISTTITVSTITALPNQTVNLKATLKAGTTLVSGKTLSFKIDGVDAGSATTDSNGVALLSHTATESLGSHTITVNFAGDGTTYAASTGTGTLKVLAATKIVADVLSAPAGSNVVYGAKLTRSDDGTALSGKTLSFYAGTTLLGSGTTDAAGRATFNATAPGVGVKTTITVKFAGDAQYKSTSGSGSITGT
jgi:hypothetical protein